jgi:PAS domain-containing protein
MIGESIEDIVYQFRALRILIAQDQLARVRREVQAAAQPIAVLDVSGSVLLVNEAFEHMIAVSSSSPGSIEDLPELFGEPSALRASLGELVRDRQPWRGEVRTVSSPNGPQTWLLRADPVFAAVNRVLGYVLFFTDLTDRKAGEAARRRFQEGIMETHRDSGIRLNTQADLIYRNLLSPVIGNAKLAALEITDGMDLDSVPGMLDSVSESVSRTASLLERVVSRSVEDPEA